MAKPAKARPEGPPPGISVGWMGSRLTRDVIATHHKTGVEVHARYPPSSYSRRELADLMERASRAAVQVLITEVTRLSRTSRVPKTDLATLNPDGFEIEIHYPNRSSIPEHLRNQRLKIVKRS